jgi:large repetitive protein
MKVFLALLLGLCVAPAIAVADEGPVYSPPPTPDTTAPETTIERTVLRAATRTVRFWFSASEPAQGFYCRLDRGDFKPCGSPRTYKHLKPGGHAFQVKAVDAAGNVDASPAIARFKIPRPHRHRR